MKNPKVEKLVIFYDGKCKLCYREIRHYKKRDKKNLLKTIDITASDFKANNYGLVQEEIEVNMHSKNESGEVFVGVDTFAEIWKRVQPYNKVSFILESKLLRPIFNTGYKVFASYVRPKLPKRKCENDRCEIMV